MAPRISRRGWFGIALAVPAARGLAGTPPDSTPDYPVRETFPMQPVEMVKEMVLVSHGNVKRVRELVEAHPSLAKAAWDWGFGDWEAAIDAASHVGNREIAEYLISKGARPTLFTAAMLGQLDLVKAYLNAQPGLQRSPGPHSISLLAHAKAGGAAAEEVTGYLESLGDAGSPAAVPLPEEVANALAGIYTFGSGPSDEIEIKAAKGQLSFTRSGTMAHGLVYLGDRTFYPAGANAVRVGFSETATLTVHDPAPVLVAVKKK